MKVGSLYILNSRSGDRRDALLSSGTATQRGMSSKLVAAISESRAKKSHNEHDCCEFMPAHIEQ